jgi:hypothetical protein
MRNVVRWATPTIAATLTAIVLGTGAAHAAVYVGSWDPQFGLPFEGTLSGGGDLGWRGQIVVDVPDDCIPSGGTGSVTNAPCAAPSYVAVVQSASVGLYDASNDTGNFSTLTFSPFAITGLYFENGELKGLNTALSAYQPDPVTGASFALQFLHTTDPDFIWGIANVPDGFSGPVLFAQGGACGQISFRTFARSSAQTPDPAIICVADVGKYPPENLRFTRIPEPGALALVAGALLAAGWAQRGRRGSRAA